MYEVIADTFDPSLYIEVRKYRKANGFSIASLSTQIDNTLVGRKMRNRVSGEVYNVQKAHKQWHRGWYIVLLLERNKSHGCVMWENLSSDCEVVITSCEKNSQKFEILEYKGGKHE